MKVAVIHPDLGIGGAERLIVDLSKMLQPLGHDVKLYTGYHDPQRCFQETIDGTLEVIVVGSWIPRTVFGRFHALMAYLKMMYIALYLILSSRLKSVELIVCDQVSACIPILRLPRGHRRRILFYCHFPDQLLTQRDTWIKSLYRRPLDWFEEWSTGLADIILVNSNFTRNVVKKTFKSLKSREMPILYPCVDMKIGRKLEGTSQDDKLRGKFIFLSLNRFERKKNLELALEAFYECKTGFEQSNKATEKFEAHLIIAGGYDNRLPECRAYFEDLEALASKLKLESHITFVPSPDDTEKLKLVQNSDVILYTPTNEHFGIVPLEAMSNSKPVIACASGGPLESIVDDVTGLLCEPDKYSFADAMLSLYCGDRSSADMGRAGYDHVKRKFSYEAFRENLQKIIDKN